jgi:hypothetical protein
VWFDPPSFPLTTLILERAEGNARSRAQERRTMQVGRLPLPRLTRRELLVLLNIVAIISVAFALGSPIVRDSSSGDVETINDRTSVAANLAASEHGDAVMLADPRVTNLNQELDRLAKRCTESPDTIGALATNVRLDLGKHGMDVSDLAILQHVRASVPSSPKHLPCTSLFAAYEAKRLHG